MPGSVRVSGANKAVKQAFVRQSGSWRQVLGGWERQGGIWRKIYTSEVVVTLGNANQVTLQSLFDPAVWVHAGIAKRVIVPSGVTIGSTSPAIAAMRTGTSWAGLLKLENAGSIQGAGGLAYGGVGGSALLADATGLVVLNSGTIYGGGGGGGKGGQGGPGYYYSTAATGPYYVKGGTEYYWANVGTSITYVIWAGGTIHGGAFLSGTTISSGGYTYVRGAFHHVNGSENYYYITRQQTVTNYSTGGAGGAGGRGYGYNHANAGGSGGAAGGTNAGTGGTGGTGGDWGANGTVGNTGSAGNNGAGAGGAAGGLAGFALQNSGNILLTNTGTILGRT